MFGDLNKSRIFANSAIFIGLVTLGGWVSLPFFPVPFTLQTLFVLLAGAVMRRNAIIPLGMYVFLGILGLPVFHNGVAGPGVLMGPTGGYLVGFIIAALIAGLAYEFESPYLHVIGFAAATIAIYACGVTWMMYSMRIDFLPALVAGVLPFIPGDIVKAAAAYTIAKRLP
jgi:biotin transport system substrate-specific component